VTQLIHFYHKLLQFFNEYDTNTNYNNCVSQIFVLYVVYLLSTSFLSHKTNFKAKTDICFCLHTCSLKDDVIDDGYDLNNPSCVKCEFCKDSFLVVLLKTTTTTTTATTLKERKTFGSTGI